MNGRYRRARHNRLVIEPHDGGTTARGGFGGMSLRRFGLLVLVLSNTAVAAGCSAAPPRAAISLPPASAGAEVVLDAYLRALVADDCDTGRRLATATFAWGSGELCGATRVTAYTINPVPAGSATEKVFATTITTSGTADGSIQAGAMTWFYDLMQQADGSWRLAGGGSGP
jgi:hypothetical protein